MIPNYSELLRTEQELAEERNKKSEEQINQEIDLLEREKWLNTTIGKQVIRELESKFTEILNIALSQSTNSSAYDCVIRYAVIESETLRKTINLIKYARYNSSTGTNNISTTGR